MVTSITMTSGRWACASRTASSPSPASVTTFDAALLERASQRLTQQLMVVGDEHGRHSVGLQLDEHRVPLAGLAGQCHVGADGVRALADADQPVTLTGGVGRVHPASVVGDLQARHVGRDLPGDPHPRSIGMSLDVRERFLEDAPQLLLHLQGQVAGRARRPQRALYPGALGPPVEVAAGDLGQVLVLAHRRSELVQRLAELRHHAAHHAVQLAQLGVFTAGGEAVELEADVGE